MGDRHQGWLAGLVVVGVGRAQNTGKVRGGIDLEALLMEDFGHSLLEATDQLLPLLPFFLGAENQGGVEPPVGVVAAAAVQDDRGRDGESFQDAESLFLRREVLGFFLVDPSLTINLDPDTKNGGRIRPGAALSRFGFRPLKGHADVNIGLLLQLTDLMGHAGDVRGMKPEDAVRLGPHDKPAVRWMIASLKRVISENGLVKRPCLIVHKNSRGSRRARTFHVCGSGMRVKGASGDQILREKP